MKVRHWQQLSLPLREPLDPRQALALWAMAVATRVVGDAGRTTIIALLDMAAERRRPARRDGARSAGWHDFQAEPIERARRVADRFGGDPGVARCAREAGMSEQDLDDAHVRPTLQEMGREGVAQRVHRHLFAQASRSAS